MDVLNSLFAKAEDGLLQPLSQRETKFWISLYTDDVALFLPPVPQGLQIKKAPLSKRGVDYPESCVICDQEEEIVQHI